MIWQGSLSLPSSLKLTKGLDGATISGPTCRSGGMADAEDLKSFGLWPCGFKSRLRHHVVAGCALFAAIFHFIQNHLSHAPPLRLSLQSLRALQGWKRRRRQQRDIFRRGLRFVCGDFSFHSKSPLTRFAAPPLPAKPEGFAGVETKTETTERHISSRAALCSRRFFISFKITSHTLRRSASPCKA